MTYCQMAMMIFLVSWNSRSPDQCGFKCHSCSSIRLCSRTQIKCCVTIPANSLTRPSPVFGKKSKVSSVSEENHTDKLCQNVTYAIQSINAILLAGSDEVRTNVTMYFNSPEVTVSIESEINGCVQYPYVDIHSAMGGVLGFTKESTFAGNSLYRSCIYTTHLHSM